MRRLAVVFLCVLAANAQERPPAERLFDGTTLAGWRGDPAVWSVRDGAIVGSTVGRPIAANTFLVLEGWRPAHFELSLQMRLEGDNNSGVQYRSREVPGDGFLVAGYQCDFHPAPTFTGMLYDERGAGIVAQRGQAALWRDAAAGGPFALGGLAAPWPVDVTKWVTLRIVAMGDLVWHELDGRVVCAVKDERADAPRAGIVALQVHAGPPMTVWCKDVVLREYASAEAMQKVVAVPLAMRALLRRHEIASARPKGASPQWIWDERAGADEELFFRRTFAVGEGAANARLAVSCDNHSRIFVNGERVGAGDAWETPVVVDVTKELRVGDNVLAVHGSNDGGPAGLVVRLSWREGDAGREVVSDALWSCSDDDPDGWNTLGFDAAKWRAVTVLAALGDPDAPWTRILGDGALGSNVPDDAPQVAVPETGVTAVSGAPIAVLRLLDVPRSLGSWVALCADPKGRLYASAEGGGLYRIVPANGLGELTTIERVAVELGGCHGLLWFRDSLYAVQNGGASGLYRITDTNGDDVLDRVELLRALDGEGEHGPHSVVVAPDGTNLLVLCGNQTKLPDLAASRVPQTWQEDRLLPRLEDPNRYWEGISPPGGWVCLVDPDGTRWELLCCGFRNPYDLVVLPNGAVVTFDSDMEWDMGLPWYRPTRLLAVESGVDYGWRIGSAKWPADWPDAPPALQDVGPASPVGMAHVDGDRSDFLVSLDWTFGTVYRDREPWMCGAPMPLTDVATARDGTGQTVVFLVTGGRGLPSSLRAVPLDDAGHDMRMMDGGRVFGWWMPHDWPEVELRTVAQILGEAAARFVRPPGSMRPPPAPHWVRARIALERLPVGEWRDVVLSADPGHPQRFLCGLLALARQGTALDLQPLLDALGRVPFTKLGHADRIAWLRVHALALLRLGPASPEQRATIGERLLQLFPSGDEREDADLAELLAFVDAKGFLDKAVPLLTPLRPSPPPAWAEVAQRNPSYGGVIATMLASMPPTGQIAIANALRTVEHGWTLDQRRTLFTFLAEARTRKGGSSYDGYLKAMIDAAWSTCTPAEQRELAAVVGKAKADAPKFQSTPPKGPGREWQPTDADALLREPLEPLAASDLAAGRNLFHAVGCAACHYFAGEGGNHGPDLTSLGSKFTARDVFEAIVDPSRVQSDQYAGKVLTKHDGTALFGHVTKGFHGDTEVWEVMPAAADAVLVRVPVSEVASVENSPLSPMPKGLANGLSTAELRQLLAFLLSRGQGLGPEPTKR